jgi:hypothetical protein
MASCDEAALYLIKAFGGEDVMKRVVGGTKWWQVRGIRGYEPLLNRPSYLTSDAHTIQIGRRVDHRQEGLAESAETRQRAWGSTCYAPGAHSGVS